MSAAPHAIELTPHEELVGLSPAALASARDRWIASAYEKLPGLTREQRDQARDRMLAAECSMWRVRFRESEKERLHEKFRADQAEQQLKHLLERIDYLNESLSPPESTGVTTTQEPGSL